MQLKTTRLRLSVRRRLVHRKSTRQPTHCDRPTAATIKTVIFHPTHSPGGRGHWAATASSALRRPEARVVSDLRILQSEIHLTSFPHHYDIVNRHWYCSTRFHLVNRVICLAKKLSPTRTDGDGNVNDALWRLSVIQTPQSHPPLSEEIETAFCGCVCGSSIAQSLARHRERFKLKLRPTKRRGCELEGEGDLVVNRWQEGRILSVANTTSTTIRLIVTPTPLAVTSTRSHHPSNFQKHQLATRKKAKGKARKAKAKEVTASTSDQPSRKTTTIATSWCFNSCCNNSSYTGFLTFASRLMHNITPKLRDLVGGNTHNMTSFFHKRCDCLKEYHREFKATVSKMSWCAICEVLKDHHLFKACVCRRLYCSEACQAADWPKHKRTCQPMVHPLEHTATDAPKWSDSCFDTNSKWQWCEMHNLSQKARFTTIDIWSLAWYSKVTEISFKQRPRIVYTLDASLDSDSRWKVCIMYIV